jgi:hypothetical protein
LVLLYCGDRRLLCAAQAKLSWENAVSGKLRKAGSLAVGTVPVKTLFVVILIPIDLIGQWEEQEKS